MFEFLEPLIHAGQHAAGALEPLLHHATNGGAEHASTLADHIVQAHDSGKGVQHASNLGDVLYKAADHAAPGVGTGVGLAAQYAVPRVTRDITDELSPRIARDLGKYYDERTGYKLDRSSQKPRQLRGR